VAFGLHERRLAAAAWTVFVLVIGAMAYLALSACDLGVHPLFGLSFCSRQAATNPFTTEQERERDLLDRLHQAQLNIARLPDCLPDPPRREPDRRAEIVPSPTPTPTPPPMPTPTPSPTPELMTMPRNLDELKGCWQSVRGDLPMVNDQEQPTGTVRICYCFGDRGRGRARYIWNDGPRCIGGVRAEISGDRLLMKHGDIGCTRNKGTVDAEDITCSKNAETNQVVCDRFAHKDLKVTRPVNSIVG
jgi:hypothetical protein